MRQTKTYSIAAFGRFFDMTSTVNRVSKRCLPRRLVYPASRNALGCGAMSPNICNLSYGTNLLPGGPAQTDISMSFGVGSVMQCGGAACTPSGNGLIYPGTKNEISKPRAAGR